MARRSTRYSPASTKKGPNTEAKLSLPTHYMSLLTVINKHTHIIGVLLTQIGPINSCLLTDLFSKLHVLMIQVVTVFGVL